MRAFAGILLMAFGFLGHLYFSNYKGDLITYPTLFSILSWLVFFSGAALLYSGVRKVHNTNNQVTDQWVDYLKTSGEKIPVEFSQCEIKENAFIENSQKNISKSEAYGEIYKAVFREPEYNSEQRSKSATVVRFAYENPKSGVKEIFTSEPVAKDRITLSFLLEEKKSTFIYVDRNNRKKYFFDLDFLS